MVERELVGKVLFILLLKGVERKGGCCRWSAAEPGAETGALDWDSGERFEDLQLPYLFPWLEWPDAS